MSVIILITGCSSDDGSNKTFRYDYKTKLLSLDPQYTQNPLAMQVLYNTMEGLFILDENSTPAYGIVKDYTISSDGLVYNFTLRDDVNWSNGSPVTAHDFEFAFKRMFMLNAPSPNADIYSNISGAKEILENGRDSDELAVVAQSDYKLTITLDSPDPYFLRSLTLPSAMPCNEAFVEETRGKYGLSDDDIISNGPFTVMLWNEDIVSIDKSSSYYDSANTMPYRVNFYINQTDETVRFNEGTTDMIKLSYHQSQQMDLSDKNTIYVENTLWVLSYNQGNGYFDDEGIRDSFSQAIVEKDSMPDIQGYTVSNDIVPDFASVGTINYRDYVGEISYNYEDGLTANQRLRNIYNNSNTLITPKLTLLLPDDQLGREIGPVIQQIWAEELAVYINTQYLTQEELITKVESGDYDMAVTPIVLQGDVVMDLLSLFDNKGVNNQNYNNDQYNEILVNIGSKTSQEEMATEMFKAEEILIEDSVILPLYLGGDVYATGETVRDIQFKDFGNIIYFKYGLK